jgi:antirestriction protein
MSERYYEGGKPEGVRRPEEPVPIEDEIAHGIEAARRADTVIDHRTARLIALCLGNGDATTALINRGEILTEPGVEEAEDNMLVVELLVSAEDLPPHQRPWLLALADYALDRSEAPGPIRGWRQLTAHPAEGARATHAPRVFVRALNELGVVAGEWIDAAQPEATMLETVATFVDRVGGSSWEIFDSTSFGGINALDLVSGKSPTEALRAIARVAQGLAEYGTAFSLYIGRFGSSQAACEQFEVRYQGRWPTLVDFAKYVADDMAWYEDVARLPLWMRDYVTLDYERLAQDATRSLEVIQCSKGMFYLYATA